MSTYAAVQVGDLYRLMREARDSTFMDAVVTHKDDETKTVTLSRPYLYASEVGGSPLVGYERITHVGMDLLDRYIHVGAGWVR
jgi:hypothetical protein